MIRAIAIDDEPLAIKVIDVYCEALSNISLEKTFSDLNKAKRYLNQFPVDLIFLDIEMPQMNGLNFYKSLNQNVQVVFTTAYEQYAVEGFNVNATDYLLKPFSLARFTEAVSRIENKIDTEHHQEVECLTIRANYKLNRIALDKISYIEAMDDYVKIYIRDEKEIVARSTMKSVLAKLPTHLFIRIHKSYIVPLRSVENVGTNEVSLGHISLPIGSSYKKDLDKVL